MQGIKLHKVADKSGGERVVRYDPETGEQKLVNPDTEGDAHEPWPLAGIRLLEAPDEVRISTTFVDQGVEEGWLTGENERFLRRPAGPADRPTSRWHHFMHYDSLTFHTLDGDVKYKVVHQPDKYVADGNDSDEVTPDTYREGNTRVDWFYGLEKEEQS